MSVAQMDMYGDIAVALLALIFVSLLAIAVGLILDWCRQKRARRIPALPPEVRRLDERRRA